jgi:hypothetical protein
MIKAFIGVTTTGYLSLGGAARFSSKECMDSIQAEVKNFSHLLIGAETVRAYGGRSLSHHSHLIYGRSMPKFKTKGQVRLTDLTDLSGTIACLGGQELIKKLMELGLLSAIQVTYTDTLDIPEPSAVPWTVDLSSFTIISSKASEHELTVEFIK